MERSNENLKIKNRFKENWDELTDPNTPGPGFIGGTIFVLISLFALLAFIKFWPGFK
jgi:hypothetical protein